MPDVHQRSENPARNLSRSKVFCRRFHGGFEGWAGEFVCNFCKHKLGTIFLAFSVEMP